MALNYGDVARFVRKHDKVVIKPGRGAKVTLLKSGEIDVHTLIETNTSRFVHKGKSYTRKEFERLVRASEEAE
jgi:hypothetical protein